MGSKYSKEEAKNIPIKVDIMNKKVIKKNMIK